MKAKVINTDFLHDGKYYSQNSIIDISPDLIKKYPGSLLQLLDSKKDTKSEIEFSEMVQDISTANNMLAPSAELVPFAEIVKPKSAKGGSKKNKRGKKC